MFVCFVIAGSSISGSGIVLNEFQDGSDSGSCSSGGDDRALLNIGNDAHSESGDVASFDLEAGDGGGLRSSSTDSMEQRLREQRQQKHQHSAIDLRRAYLWLLSASHHDSSISTIER